MARAEDERARKGRHWRNGEGRRRRRRRMVEDEGNEEGDRGSIVAFRIPCRPSDDFQLPSSSLSTPPLPSFARRLPLHTPLQLALSFRVLPASSSRLAIPVIPRSPLSSASPVATHPRAIPRDSHETINPRPPSRTCTVNVHASLRRPRPTDQTADSSLSLAFSSVPRVLFPPSLLAPRLWLHLRAVSVSLSSFPPLSLFLLHSTRNFVLPFCLPHPPLSLPVCLPVSRRVGG